MWTLKPLVFISICATLTLGCTRQTDSQASIQLDFSGLSKGVGAQSSFDLKFVAVNVYEADSKAVVAHKSIHATRNSNDDVNPINPQLPLIEVPTGINLVVQVLAVVENASGSSQFWYEDATKTFDAGVQPLEIKVAQVGSANVGDGQISGRYLKSGGDGPTGRVKVYFQVPNRPDRKKMLVEDNLEMFSGWFRFFALEGAELEYVGPDGSTLFGGPIGIDTPSLGIGAASFVAYTPEYFSMHGPNGSTRRHYEPAKGLYGFFGPGVTGQEICYSTTTADIPYAYNDAVANTLISWTGSTGDATTAHQVKGGGYPVSTSPGNLCEGTGTRYVDYISYNEQSATSHDSVLGFKGPFVIPYDSGAPTNSDVLLIDNDGMTMTVRWTYLPGVQTDGPTKGIDGARLFARAEDPNGSGNSRNFTTGDDMVKCADLDKTTSGFPPFTYLGDVPATVNDEAESSPITLATLNANLATAINNGNATLIACPYALDTKNNPVFFGSAAVNYPSHGGGGGYNGGGIATKIGLQSGNPIVNAGDCREIDIVLLNATNSDSDPMENASGVTVDLAGAGGMTFKEYCPSGSAVLDVSVPPGFNRTRVGVSSGTEGAYTFTLTDAAAALTAYSGTLTVAPYGAVTNLQFVDASNNPIPGILNGNCKAMKLIGKDSMMTNRTFYTDSAIALTASSGAFYNNPTCSSSPITSIQSGVSYATNTFYFKSTTNGWASLNATITNYQPGTTAYTLSGMFSVPVGVAGQPAFLVITSATLENGMCGAVTISVRDVNSSLANVADVTDVIFDGLVGDVYSSASCAGGTEIPPEASISAGASSATIYVRPYQSGNFMLNAWGNGVNGTTHLFGSGNILVNPGVPNFVVTEINRNEFVNNSVYVVWDPPGNTIDTDHYRVWVSSDGSTSPDINAGSDLCHKDVAVGVNAVGIYPCPLLVDAGQKFIKIVGIDFYGQPIAGSLQVHQMLLYHNNNSTRVLSLGNGNAIDLLTVSGGFGPTDSPGGTVDCSASGALTADAILSGCTYTAPTTGGFADTIVLHTEFNGIHHFEYVRFTQ